MSPCVVCCVSLRAHYTQGLIYQAPDTLYESTGSVNGPSTVREVDLTTGEVRNKNALGTSHFAEGRAAQPTTDWSHNKGQPQKIIGVPVPVMQSLMYSPPLYCTGALYTFSYTVATNQSSVAQP